jgi:hypothetical protein
MARGYCPECAREISFTGPPRKGHEVTCPSFEAELKVVRAAPMELDWENGDSEDTTDDSFDDEDEDEDDDPDFD